MKYPAFLAFMIVGLLPLGTLAQEASPGSRVVAQDGDIVLTAEELSFIASRWTPDMQRAAASDAGDRIELLNLALSSKKIANEFANVDPSLDPDAYWTHVLTVRNMNRDFVVKQHLKNLEIPDFSELAKEHYETQKQRYAFVAEQRKTSHILRMCPMGSCNREDAREFMQGIHDQLEEGADFAEMARKHSGDPGNAPKGGVVDRWLTLGMQGMEPHYVGAAFEIEEVGDISPVVDTRYGIHIIKLDEVQAPYYKTFEEVRGAIVADLESEYRSLAAKEFDARFRLTESAAFDDEALDEILAPYKVDEDPAALREAEARRIAEEIERANAEKQQSAE